jgi:UDP-2,3-diacylglucosamine pyrophosphatase LpxH
MNAPVFVVSDLHIGSGGPRDSFCQNNRSSSFNNFLDYVEKEGGELVILGDFIDLWRFTIEKIIKVRRDLLDRLAEMEVICIPGNHDQAVSGFINSPVVPHPFFQKIKEPFIKIIGDKKFSFMHGHELDPLNRNITPRVGRMLGLSSSLFEYARGRPFFSSDMIGELASNVEEKMFLCWFDVIRSLTKFVGADDSAALSVAGVLPRQKRFGKLLLKHDLKKQIDGNDVTISAHTHRPCRFQDWYFNSGSWTGRNNNFIQIFPDSKVGIYNWEKDIPRHNDAVVYAPRFASQFKTGYAAVN